MILKILGVLDLLSGIVLIVLRFAPLKVIPGLLAVYLIVKSIIFLKNISSVIDLIAAIHIIFAMFGNYYSLTWLFVLWLLQKGVFSLYS